MLSFLADITKLDATPSSAYLIQVDESIKRFRNLCKTQDMQARYGLEWAIRRIFKPIAIAMGKKVNKIDRPSPCHECG